MVHSLPTGIVTFLFTDIEGSTQLWERYPEAMKPALAHHDRILRQAIESHEGHVVKTTGDGCHAVFASAANALDAALDAQRRLSLPDRRLPTTDLMTAGPLIRIRIGLHTGEAELRQGDYYGSAVNRAARIMSIGHGGQILLSSLTADLVVDRLPSAVMLRDLGEYRLRDLSRPERVYQVVAEGLPADFPPLNSLDAYPGNLPVQLTSFVGRERELSEVKQLLATTRLLTLTGSGGTGKTRLSLQTAADVQANYQHGAWLAELAPLADPALVPSTIAGLYTLSPQPGLSLLEVLLDYLRGRHLLLILDNCEHLVEACAQLASDLLPACPRLTILASSREGLGVAGETTFHVPTLALPAKDDTTAAAVCRYDAADLFLHRARAANPAFAVTDSNAPAIAQIVRRLDGIPLAIELAAARVRLLSPEQIVARLDDRFRLLTGGSRTALPRQQTLRALIDWSYDLLDHKEQWFFRQLGVFVGGWALEAAEQVASDELRVSSDERDLAIAQIEREEVLDLLAGLVNKSLVMVDEGEAETHYRFLETVRQYARDKLFKSGEGEAARDRHLAYFGRFLNENSLVKITNGVAHIDGQVWIMLVGQDNQQEGDVDNLRGALDWAIGKDPELALLMASQMCLDSSVARAGGNGCDRIIDALAAVETLSPAQGEAAARRREIRLLAHLALGSLAIAEGDNRASVDAFGEAARLAREGSNIELLARALVQRSLSAGFLDDHIALTAGEEAARLFAGLGDYLGVAQALGQMAEVHIWRGEIAQARLLAEQSQAVVRDSGSSLQNALSYLTSARLARALGDMDSAEAQFRAGYAEFHRLGNRVFAAIMLSDLGHMLRQTGRITEAREIYRDVIREWQDFGRRAPVANMLENYAFISRAVGQVERAARLFGAAESLRDEVHVDMTPFERQEYEQEVSALRAALPSEQFAAAWAAGRRLSLDEAVNCAVEM